MNTEQRLPFRGICFGRLIITSCRNTEGAPVVDDSFTNDQEGNRYRSKTILLTPWRKNRYGEHVRQRALVIGWRQ